MKIIDVFIVYVLPVALSTVDFHREVVAYSNSLAQLVHHKVCKKSFFS